MHLLSADATTYFFADENMKKLASKVAEFAQIQPKSQFLFHKNLPPCDCSIMTLLITLFRGQIFAWSLFRGYLIEQFFCNFRSEVDTYVYRHSSFVFDRKIHTTCTCCWCFWCFWLLAVIRCSNIFDFLAWFDRFC